MERKNISKLLGEFPFLRHQKINKHGLPQGDWFVFEVKSIPPHEEIKVIIADIEDGLPVRVIQDGSLRHSLNCEKENHSISTQLEKSIRRIEEQTFRVAIWEGVPSLSGNLPIPIVLEPEISYFSYPDHPHLSRYGRQSSNTYIPYSICYAENGQELGNNDYDRISNAVIDVCIWLFRHQVWLATRKNASSYWIGPDTPAEKNKQFLYFRNPFAKCYCNSGKLYHLCHLQKDFSNLLNAHKIDKVIASFRYFKGNDGLIDLARYHKWWESNVFIPQVATLRGLKAHLL